MIYGSWILTLVLIGCGLVYGWLVYLRGKYAPREYQRQVDEEARQRFRRQKFESDVEVRMMELQEEGRMADLKETPETQGKAGTWKR